MPRIAIDTPMDREQFGCGAEHPGPRLAILAPGNILLLYSTNMDREEFGSGAEHPAPRLAILSPSNTTFVFDQYYSFIRPQVRVRGRTSGAESRHSES